MSAPALAADRARPNRTLALARAWWLPVANLCVAVFVGLPLLAPLLLAADLDAPAGWIYSIYEYACHQWAFRSYFLFGAQSTYAAGDLAQLIGPEHMHGFAGSPELGYKVAFCQRCVAIYTAVLIAGVAYTRLRGRIRPLGLAPYGLLILPMALDGVAQIVGQYESSAEARTLTGALFGLASAWLVYPRVEAALVGPTPRSARLGEVGA